VLLQEEWKRKIDAVGGLLHAKVKKGICSSDQFMKMFFLKEIYLWSL